MAEPDPGSGRPGAPRSEPEGGPLPPAKACLSAEARAQAEEPPPEERPSPAEDLAPEEFAPAKVNLALHVLARRGDGYHTLDTLVAFPPVGDRLRLDGRAAGGPRLSVTGPGAADLCDGGDNLVTRAALALGVLDAVLTLNKHLPVAAGLGGGSADAAATLRLLDRACGLGTAPARLHALARGLGADVPMCLASRPWRAGGIGDELAAAPAYPSAGLLLANPRIPVATAAVFRALAAPSGRRLPALPAGWRDAADLAAWLADCGNDLEPAAAVVAPEIVPFLAELAALPGVLLARLSGSGATGFALFPHLAAAEAAAAALRRHRPGWWIVASPLAAADEGAARD